MKTTNKITNIVEHWRCHNTPRGSFAVYVGVERSRFVIPRRFINLPVFKSLLNQAEDEFGYPTGGFVLPCDIVFFKKLLKVLEKDERRFSALDLDDFKEMFCGNNLVVEASSACENATGLGWLGLFYCGRKLGFER
ncbi:auxin-responsive protein SAUR66-like [Bidens hawaiensis]|uniref:auxin-responsive protein SAUR66-like n=1 Tax=Bidens hawaiensis TaxID=980011 RepID=UPI00404AE4A7